MSVFYGTSPFGIPTRHKVFISYHHANDQAYRNYFESLFANIHDIMVSKSVQDGDINPSLPPETIRQKIRDGYLRDSTVTVVLIGAETWKRKHVDWEIGASIRDTKNNPRSGLLGIILPTYPRQDITKYNPYTIPPRLYDNIQYDFANIQCGFARIYNWSNDPAFIQTCIHDAFKRKNTITPDNSFPSFDNNRTGNGWQK